MPVLLNGHCAEDPDAIAVADAVGEVTWREFDARVNRWIHVLTGLGLRVGDRLACAMGNRREAFEVLLACLHTGVTIVPVNWHLTERELAHVLRDSDPRAVVVDGSSTACVRSVPTGTIALLLGDVDAEGVTAVEPLLAAAPASEANAATCGAIMFYTSGTTGEPKGVMSSLFVTSAPFDRVDRLAQFARRGLGIPSRGRILLDGPWYHSAQLFFALVGLLLGSRLVIRPRFDPAETLQIVDREMITAVHLVPTQLVRMLALPAQHRAAFTGASLQRVWHGGGPCPEDVKRQMITWWGPILTEYYGATEAGAVTLIDSSEWLRRPSSVGRAVPGTEIVVVDDDGLPVAPGTRGRIFVRRPGQFFHYHNAPEKTDAVHLEPGTFTLGEVGHIDAEGYLYLTGRASDVIISGAINVYPAEVEAVLRHHPAVRDVAVIGMPDPEFGERIVAVVASDNRSAGLAADLDALCRRDLATFKIPRIYHIVDDLPRDPMGKLRATALHDLVATLEGGSAS